MRGLLAVIAAIVALALMPAVVGASGELLATERLFYAPGAGNPNGETYPGTKSGAFDCNNGTFDLDVQEGHAYGPFSGTFHDSVSIEFAAGALGSADVDFEIDAGDTTISGSATWAGGPAAVTCTSIDEGGGDYTNRFRAGSFSNPLHFDYEATVDGPGGASIESGMLHGYVWFDCWNCFDLGSSEGTFQLTFDWPDPDQASLDVGPGDSVSTGFGEATADDPTTTRVFSPNAGTVTISEGSTGTPSSGYAFIGQEVTISAPPATADDPLIIDFRVDASVIPPGDNAATITIFRNGDSLSDCTFDDDGLLVGLPCVSGRFNLADGDAQIRVATEEASVWDLGVAAAEPPTAEIIASAVAELPEAAFKANGHRTAITAQLAVAQKLIGSGEVMQAGRILANLLGHVDGCGIAADNNDWIVSCDPQLEVRAMVDALIADLGG